MNYLPLSSKKLGKIVVYFVVVVIYSLTEVVNESMRPSSARLGFVYNPNTSMSIGSNTTSHFFRFLWITISHVTAECLDFQLQ